MTPPTPLFEERNAIFWEAAHKYKQWGTNPDPRLISFIWRNFNHNIRDTVSILDIGCGCGASSVYTADRGHTVVGIDFSPTAVERATRLKPDNMPNLTYIAGSATSLPFPDGTFNAVTDILCLQYLNFEETSKAVSEIHRVLKPGGLFFSMADDVESTPSLTEYGCSVRLSSQTGLTRLYGTHFDFIHMRREEHRDLQNTKLLWWITEMRRKP